MGAATLGRREAWLAAALAFSGVLAWWLERAADGPAPAPSAGERRPDSIVEGLEAVTLNAAGEPERRLVAERLRHYADDGSSELDRPLLHVYRDDGPQWRVHARSAWINAGGDEILLQEDVVLEQDASAAGPALELRSSELLVLPELEYAETSRFAEVERGADWLTGTDGMRAWLGDALRLQVFGRVRSRVGPEARRGPGSERARAPAAAAGGAPP